MEPMLEEVKYCKKIVKSKFNKPLKMKNNSKKLTSATFAMRNILIKAFGLEITVM